MTDTASANAVELEGVEKRFAEFVAVECPQRFGGVFGKLTVSHVQPAL